MICVCTWRWGNKWGPEYFTRLAAGFARQVSQLHRFAVISDQPPISGAKFEQWEIPAEDKHLVEARGCFARMRIFDAGFQSKHGIKVGDRVVNVDVDVVATGPLDPLFDRYDEFNVMKGFNFTNPCPVNGSLWMLRGGERHDVWDDFSLEAYRARGVPHHAFPDDQGWLHYKFPDAKAYTPKDGVYAFKKIGWGLDGRRVLPEGARLIAFPGRDPAKYPEVPWIAKHWR